MPDLDPFLRRVVEKLDAARLSPGNYKRYTGGPDISDPYGCADAANILYTIGAFPRDLDERAAFVRNLNALQSEDGLWRETTHHPIHTTAHCLAALELFDADPATAPTGLAPFVDPEAMEAFLDRLNWRTDPWRASHEGAGLHSCLTLGGMVTRAWRQRYCDWLAGHCDMETGFWRAGDVGPVERDGTATLFPHLAGTFHYLFALDYERQPHPAPARLIDSALALAAEGIFPLGTSVGFAEIDWVYCLTRMGRQTAHRFDERIQALRAFAERYTRFLANLPDDDAKLNDLHLLFGSLCALAELQVALPGALTSEQPLKLVLDRRPFI